jgi:hypothetical protein
MSSQVNVSQIGYGTIDPGFEVDVFSWTTTESSYNKERKRASFFTAIPDPLIPVGNAGTVEFDGISQVEITRVWNMVRTTIDANFKDHHVFQCNATVLNSGQQTCAFELLQAETNN